MKLKIFFSFAAIYLIWGSTYLAAHFGLGSIPPYLMSALRFSVAGLVLLAWCFGRKYPWPDKKTISVNFLGGVLMLVGGSGSVLWAQQYVPSGLAAILVSALPVWFVLLDKKEWAVYFKSRLVITGVLLGFAGIIILFGSNLDDSGQGSAGFKKLLAIGVIIAGTISWTIGSLYVKYQSAPHNVTAGAGIQLLAGGIASLLLSPLLDNLSGFSFSQVSLSAWMALTYLTVFGSVITYMAYMYLLSERPAAQVGTHAYVNPVIAVILGVLFANEKLVPAQISALVIILVSVLLVNLASYRK
ncbi:EamA family transporter [Flavihumibacter stibioxidans]|uniref:EamA domain-containing protein n=1 Tax=Flavihumibacter stibioxidans TaxID=1834163 RepID=A0ABR7MAR0_9BACT|nr:EamA family transporter [Flavihumibacter stibioxidans]MBC6492105.1 hypothetical protein [Flavihumibacter stibioxidans]